MCLLPLPLQASVEILDASNQLVASTTYLTLPVDNVERLPGQVGVQVATIAMPGASVLGATVCLVWNVPQSYTGPAMFTFDDVELLCR